MGLGQRREVEAKEFALNGFTDRRKRIQIETGFDVKRTGLRLLGKWPHLVSQTLHDTHNSVNTQESNPKAGRTDSTNKCKEEATSNKVERAKIQWGTKYPWDCLEEGGTCGHREGGPTLTGAPTWEDESS